MNDSRPRMVSKNLKLLFFLIFLLIIIGIFGLQIDWKTIYNSIKWNPSENNALYVILLSITANIATALLVYMVLERKRGKPFEKIKEQTNKTKFEEKGKVLPLATDNECLILGNRYENFSKTSNFASTGKQTLTILCEICRDIDKIIESGLAQNGQALYDFNVRWEKKLQTLKDQRESTPFQWTPRKAQCIWA